MAALTNPNVLLVSEGGLVTAKTARAVVSGNTITGRALAHAEGGPIERFDGLTTAVAEHRKAEIRLGLPGRSLLAPRRRAFLARQGTSMQNRIVNPFDGLN